MTTYQLEIVLHSYIGHPYWPERERVINIVKESGMSRARSTANRRSALEQYLKSAGMTLAQFEELQARADEPFYRDGEWISVPEIHVTSMMVNTAMTIRAAGRAVAPEKLRSLVQVSAWRTDRRDADGIWERFAVVTSGTGAKLSNQRALRSNPYIGTPPGQLEGGQAAKARGRLMMDPSMVKPSVMLDMLRYAGTDVGIGASRKMGWGRFDVLAMTET